MSEENQTQDKVRVTVEMFKQSRDIRRKAADDIAAWIDRGTTPITPEIRNFLHNLRHGQGESFRAAVSRDKDSTMLRKAAKCELGTYADIQLADLYNLIFFSGPAVPNSRSVEPASPVNYFGVTWFGGKWRTRLSVNGVQEFLDESKDQETAARMYDCGVTLLNAGVRFKKRFNFPDEDTAHDVDAAKQFVLEHRTSKNNIFALLAEMEEKEAGKPLAPELPTDDSASLPPKKKDIALCMMAIADLKLELAHALDRITVLEAENTKRPQFFLPPQLAPQLRDSDSTSPFEYPTTGDPMPSNPTTCKTAVWQPPD